MLKTTKAVPFGAHLTVKLEGTSSKMICALSAATTCSDDTRTSGNTSGQDDWLAPV